MAHEYKEQLALNLMEYYKDKGFVFHKHFENRDEILMVIPKELNVESEHSKLYAVLESLPDINLPWERTLISYSHEKWKDHQYTIINPTDADNRAANLIAMGAGHYITQEEYKN